MRRSIILGTILLVGSATAATASHPSPRDMARVRGLAHELERAAHHVHRTAERQRHHFDRSEESAFRALHRLADASRHFHRQSERFFQSPRHTERDFRNVVAAYVESVHRLDGLHGSFVVERNFQRVGHLVVQLDRYYGFLNHDRWDRYRGRHGYWPGRHGSFERGSRGHHGPGVRGRGHDRGRGHGHYESRGRGHLKHGARGSRHDRSRDDRYDRDHGRHEDRHEEERRRRDSRDLDRNDERGRDDDRRGAWRTRPN